MEGRERPLYGLPIELLDVEIVDDVSPVIKSNKRVPIHRVVRNQGYSYECGHKKNRSPQGRDKEAQAVPELDVSHAFPVASKTSASSDLSSEAKVAFLILRIAGNIIIAPPPWGRQSGGGQTLQLESDISGIFLWRNGTIAGLRLWQSQRNRRQGHPHWT